MTGFNSIKPLSSSISCGNCGNTFDHCSCSGTVWTSVTSGISNINTGMYAGTPPNSFTIGGTSGTLQIYCQQCGQSFNQCQCSAGLSNQNIYGMCTRCHFAFPNCVCSSSYLIMPNTITTPTITWTTGTTTLTNGELYLEFEVMDIETKDKFDFTGWFQVEHKDTKDGIYGRINELRLPVELKDCFVKLKDSGGYKLWQIRSPLAFEIHFKIKDNQGDREEVHFFTLTSFTDAVEDEKFIILMEPRLQEVPSTMELVRILELQRVFTKLLRRI